LTDRPTFHSAPERETVHRPRRHIRRVRGGGRRRADFGIPVARRPVWSSGRGGRGDSDGPVLRDQRPTVQEHRGARRQREVRVWTTAARRFPIRLHFVARVFQLREERPDRVGRVRRPTDVAAEVGGLPGRVRYPARRSATFKVAGARSDAVRMLAVGRDGRRGRLDRLRPCRRSPRFTRCSQTIYNMRFARDVRANVELGITIVVVASSKDEKKKKRSMSLRVKVRFHF